MNVGGSVRYYDPRTSRFLTSDPLGLYDGPNTYSYVQNNPINRIDPDGRYAHTIGIRWSVRRWLNPALNAAVRVASHGRNWSLGDWLYDQVNGPYDINADTRHIPAYNPNVRNEDATEPYSTPQPGVIPGTTESLGPVEIEAGEQCDVENPDPKNCGKILRDNLSRCGAGNFACRAKAYAAFTMCMVATMKMPGGPGDPPPPPGYNPI